MKKYFIILFFLPQLCAHSSWYELPFSSHHSSHSSKAYVDTWSSTTTAYSILENDIKLEQQIAEYVIPTINHLREELEGYHLIDEFCRTYKSNCNIAINVCTTLERIQPGNLNLVDQVEQLIWIDTCVSQAESGVQRMLNDALTHMHSYLIDDQGHVRTSLNFFEKHGLWNTYSSNVKYYSDKVKQWYSSALGQIDCAQQVLHDYGMGNKPPIGIDGSRLCVTGDLRDYRELKTLCAKGSFESAYQIVQKHESRFTKNPQDNFFQKAYAHNFQKKYDHRGIDNRFLNDPKVQIFGDLHERMTPSPRNVELEQRYNAKQQIISSCHITKPSAQLEAYIYDVLDDYVSHNYQGVVDKFSQMAGDHRDSQVCQVYAQLVDERNGFPKFLKANATVSGTRLSSSIHRVDNTDLRMMVNRLGLVDTSSPAIQAQVAQALEYVKDALNNTNSPSRYFANRIINALEKGIDDPVLHLPDLCSKLPNQVDDSLREKVAGYIADKLADYNQCADIYIQKVAHAYQGMVNGDPNAHMLLEKTFGHPTQENILLIDVEQLRAKVAEVNEDFNTIFDRLAQAYNDVAVNGSIGTESYTQTDAATRLCLLEHGINPLAYERFTGDQIQQVWHQLDVKALHAGGHLSLQAMPLGAKQLLEFGLQSNFAVNAFVKAKDFGNAFHATTAATVAYNMVLKGINLTGSILSETTIVKVIKDPIGCLVDLARRIDAHMQELPHICRNVQTIKEFAEHKTEATSIWHNLYQSFQEKGYGWAAKELGVVVVDHMTLGWVSNAAKATALIGSEKIRSLGLAKNEAAIAKTTAGTLEKLGNKVGSEISAQVENPITKIYEKFSAKLRENCPASCVNQYEKLKQALSIEEFTSIIKTTKHGIQRLMERGFTPEEVKAVLYESTFTKAQSNGAKAYVKQLNDRFNVIVLSEKQRVVTCLKNIDQKALNNLGKNYGWK